MINPASMEREEENTFFAITSCFGCHDHM